jgi:ubiquinone/menaquinone biosynthesis C-methylase UbiE
VDISKTFVEIAKRNAAAESVVVRFQAGNASALPIEDSSMDFVVCRAAFKNFSEPLRGC